MAKADLHIHTKASDGMKTASEVVVLAEEKGLTTIAITDHDTYNGYFEARAKGDELGIRVLPGVEMSTDYNGRECHILGYCFDVGNEELKSVLMRQKKIRVERATEMVNQLNKLGFDLDLEDVQGEAGAGNLSRVHIARVLVKKGYASGIQDVFNRYLGEDKPAYHKISFIECTEAIKLIQQAGGVAILAHPGLTYIWEDLRFFLNSGIDGIEFIHPVHNFDLQKKYKTWAENFGLLPSGGSDFHGKKKDFTHFGNVTIDDSYADAILEKSRQRKNITENRK